MIIRLKKNFPSRGIFEEGLFLLFVGIRFYDERSLYVLGAAGHQQVYGGNAERERKRFRCA